MSDSEDVDNRLLIEYRQWKLTEHLRSYFSRHFPVNKREWLHNTFDRWLLSIHEDESDIYQKDTMYPLYPLCLDANDTVHIIIVKEIAKESFKLSVDECVELMKKFLEHIEIKKGVLLKEYQQKPTPLKLLTKDLKVRGGKQVTIGGVQVGDLETKQCSRINYLYQNYGLKVTAIMLLRYESLGTGSYQWGDPIDLHQAYYTKFGVRYEGFASPLNSRFLGQKDARFCSLFPDTDAIFGSLGNFMHIDFNEHPGGWSVNPPFIESLLEDVSKKILKALDDASGEPGCLYFFCCMPYWDDTPGWILLKQSSHLIHHVNFGKSAYVVQTAYGESLDPHCGLSHFALGYLPEGTKDEIDSLDNVMHKTYSKWKRLSHEQQSQSSLNRKRSFNYDNYDDNGYHKRRRSS